MADHHHQIAELYRERNLLAQCVASLLHLASMGSYGGPTDNDDKAPGWPVLVIDTSVGQISWHLAAADAVLAERTAARPYDGHTKATANARLEELAIRLARLSAPPVAKTAKAKRVEVMPTVNGRRFRCECGCNVFSTVPGTNILRCNACGAEFEGS